MVFYRREVPMEVMDIILLLWLGIAFLTGIAYLFLGRRFNASKKQGMPSQKNATATIKKAKKKR